MTRRYSSCSGRRSVGTAFGFNPHEKKRRMIRMRKTQVSSFLHSSHEREVLREEREERGGRIVCVHHTHGTHTSLYFFSVLLEVRRTLVRSQVSQQSCRQSCKLPIFLPIEWHLHLTLLLHQKEVKVVLTQCKLTNETTIICLLSDEHDEQRLIKWSSINLCFDARNQMPSSLHQHHVNADTSSCHNFGRKKRRGVSFRLSWQALLWNSRNNCLVSSSFFLLVSHAFFYDADDWEKKTWQD